MVGEDTEIFRYFEFKEEATRGVAETTPEMSCDAASLSPGLPDNPEMEYKGSIGRGKTLHRPAFYSTTPKMEVGVDLKILSRLLYFALGKRIVKVTEGDGSGLDPDAVQYYDASGNSYSSKKTAFKDSTPNDVIIPGHAAAEVGDYLAIGSIEKFTKITTLIGTPKTDVSTLIWEYWDGDSWQALTVTDGTTGFTAAAGSHDITFTAPVDWVETSINSSGQLFFVRCRCSAFTSAGTAGAVTSGTIGTQDDTSTEYIYSSNKVLLPSFTSFMGMDIDEMIIPGCIMNKLELNVENEFITVKGDMVGMGETLSDLKTEAELNKNEDYPLAFYECDVHMRSKGSTTPWGVGTLISDDVRKLKISVENSAKAEDGQSLGTRFPHNIPCGERKLGFEFDYNYLEKTWYDLMQGGPNGPQEGQGSTEFEMMIAFNAGIYGNAQFHFPRVIVTSGPIESKGRDLMVQTIGIDAYQDDITVPTTPTQIIYSEVLATFVHNFPDVSGSFDGPAVFNET